MQHLTTQHLMTAKTHVALEPGLHVAIISDGNGRWATSRGLPRSAGHRAGAESARRIIEAAPLLGIQTLTLFALSSANWKRPAAEVNAILRLLHEYLLVETSHCVEEGVRLSVIGRRDRIPGTLRQAIADSEAATAGGTRLHLRLAIDYSAREAIFIRSPNSRRSLFQTSSRKFFVAGPRKWTCSSGPGANSAFLIFFCGSAPSPSSSFCQNGGPILRWLTSNARYRNSAGASERAVLCQTRLRDSFV